MTDAEAGMSEAPSPAPESDDRDAKSAAAFRTITEVARELDLPQHVLRFWETKFPQLKPIKRGGGRRYYRPEHVDLLKRIRDLLHREGYTIKGVQKLLRQGQAALRDATSEDAPETGVLGGAQRAEVRAVLRDLEAMRDALQKVL